VKSKPSAFRKPFLAVELLENRVHPVIGVGPTALPPTETPSEFDGIVQFRQNVGGGAIPPPNAALGSGALLSTRTHILTAAHVLIGNGSVALFNLKRQRGFFGAFSVPIAIPVPADMTFSTNQIRNKDWAGTVSPPPPPPGTPNLGVNDIAVVKLIDPVLQTVNSRLIAPFGAQGYEVASGNMLGKTFTIAGYGERGAGLYGSSTDATYRLVLERVPAQGKFTLSIALPGAPSVRSVDVDVSKLLSPPNGSSAAAELAKAIEQIPEFQSIAQGRPNITVSPTTGPVGGLAFFIRAAGVMGYTQLPALNVQTDGQPNFRASTMQIWQGGGGATYLTTGQNTFDGRRPNDSKTLQYDFDSGVAANDALVLNPRNLGLGNAEGFAGRGDSGGAQFVRNQQSGKLEIAGLASFNSGTPQDITPYVDALNTNVAPDGAFGEIATSTDATQYGQFIDSATRPFAGGDDLVLDMNYQVVGADLPGENVQIVASVEGSDIVLKVQDPLGTYSGEYFRGRWRAANGDRLIRSLIIRGSSDNETVYLPRDFPIDVSMRMGGGDDNLYLLGYGNTQNVKREFDFDGGLGINRIAIDDTPGFVAPQDFRIANSDITFGLNGPTLTYDPRATDNIAIYGGSGGNTFDVSSTAANVTTRIFGGSGNDRVRVRGLAGANLNNLSGILGKVEIDGQGGANSLEIFDGNMPNPPGVNYIIGPNSITRQGIGVISIQTQSFRSIGFRGPNGTPAVPGAGAGARLNAGWFLQGGRYEDSALILGSNDAFAPELRGKVPSVSFDQIVTTGQVQLDGQLDILLQDGFRPASSCPFYAHGIAA